MSEILDAISALGEATQGMNIAKESFEAIRQDANSVIDEAGSKVDTYINGARKEYSRFNHYVPLSEKITIPALGLTNDEIEAYQYSGTSDYFPVRGDEVLCFSDIPEFANGFSDLVIPEGMSAYLHMLVNVDGANTSTMYTYVHILRENKGQGGYHSSNDTSDPFIFSDNENVIYQIEGRNWGDNYKDRNQLKISNYNKYNYFGSGALRVINLGQQDLEIFGVGIEVRV